MKSLVYSLFFLLPFGVVCQSQIGPGGVGTSSNLTIWLDASQMNLTDGASVSTFVDTSGNDNDFTATGGARPTYLASGSVGGKPSISFDGNDVLSSAAISSLDTDLVTWFTVSKNSENLGNSVKRGVVYTKSSAGNATWGTTLKKENNSVTRFEVFARTTTPGLAIANTEIGTANYKNSFITSGKWLNSNSVVGEANGAATATATGGNESGFTHTNTFLGSFPGVSSNYQGEIPELIIFNEVINTAQEKIINNYLSAKYSITLAGSVVYDNGSTHGNEVAGIGRDDASNVHLSAKGTGIVTFTSAGLDDGDFLMWGHDEGGYATTTSNVPTSYGTSGNRLTQIWKVSELSEVGSLTMTVDLTGITFGASDDYELLISSDNDFTDADIVTGTFLSDVLTFSLVGTDLEDDYFFTIGNTQGSIESIVDGQDWDDTSTWSCTCIPSSTSNVVIKNTHEVTLTDAREVLDLQIELGGSLIIDANSSLSVKGDLDVDGDISGVSPNKITFDGLIAQNLDVVGSLTFDTLELNNSNGLEINTGTYAVTGAIIPTDGIIDFNDNDLLFESNASGSGYVGPQGVGATINGLANLSVQKFIPAGTAGMRNVSFPYNSSFELNQWDDEIFISGYGFPDGCAFTSSGCYHSANYWDASTQGYKAITDLDSIINVDNGVEIFLGDNLNVWNTHTMTSVGGSLMLDESVDIDIQNQWNLVGNPFLSPIDWDDITRNDLVGTGNYFYVYDVELGGFRFWNGINQTADEPTSPLSNGIIPAFQGYWVFHSGASTTLTIDQSCKSISSTDNFTKDGDFNTFSVVLKESSTGKFSTVWFSDKNDNGFDVPKLPVVESAFDFYGFRNSNFNEPLNAIKLDLGECNTVDFTGDRILEDSYSLIFQNLPIESEVFLLNKVTNEKVKVSEGEEIELIAKALSQSDLQLLIYPSITKCESSNGGFNSSFVVYLSETMINIESEELIENSTVKVYSISGELIYSNEVLNNFSNRLNFNLNLNSGTYLFVIEDHNTGYSHTEKLVVTR